MFGIATGDLVLARRQSHAELPRVGVEVLPILVEARGLFGVVDERVDLPVVDPQRQGNRVGAERTRPAEPHADDVVRFDRHAMHGVERVREAEPGAVVLRRERPRVAVAPPIRSEPDERRGHRRSPEHGRAGDPVGRRQVFLHERRRERQHIPDVVEAVARVVLREVVRRAQLDSQQISNRVVVFLAVQPPRGDAAGIRRRDAGRCARARARATPATACRWCSAGCGSSAGGISRCAASARPRPSARDDRSASRPTSSTRSSDRSCASRCRGTGRSSPRGTA